MQISSDHIFINDPFVAALSVISTSINDFSEWLLIFDISSAAVIFKADHRHIRKFALQNNVIDESIILALFCVNIYDGKPFDHTLISGIVGPE